MLKSILDAVLMIWEKIYDFLDISLWEIHYSDVEFSIVAGLTLLSIFIAKILWRHLKRDKKSQKYSGHEMSRYYLSGSIARFLNAIPKCVFALAVVGILLALSEPFLAQTKEDKKVIESRIRVDLRDVSSSMVGYLGGTQNPKAIAAVDAHLEFLQMRKGKNDRVSFWIFGSFPHLIEDFIIDDELYYQQVEDAPWLIASDGDSLKRFFENNPTWPIPEEKYGVASGDGAGTNMVLALQAVIKQFDQDEKTLKGAGIGVRKIKRSILIITDAEVDAFPSKELEELRARNIRPYVIWIKSSPQVDDESGDIIQTNAPPKFAQRIREYGGEYFDITDESSLKMAYESIDKLETTEVVITRKSFKLPLFQNFISMAIAVMCVAVFVALLIEPFGIYP